MAEKQIDPGNEPSASKTKLAYLRGYLTRNPEATLQRGEGKILLDEITRLETLIELNTNMTVDDLRRNG